MEMLQRDELLGGLRGNEHEIFLSLFMKMNFVTLIKHSISKKNNVVQGTTMREQNVILRR